MSDNGAEEIKKKQLNENKKNTFVMKSNFCSIFYSQLTLWKNIVISNIYFYLLIIYISSILIASKDNTLFVLQD